MNGPPLSWQERKILEEIETDLRTDRDLDDELSRMHVRPFWRAEAALRAWRRAPVGVLMLLIGGSFVLLCLTVAAPTGAVLVPAVLVWVVTAAALLTRRSRPRDTRRSRGSDDPHP